VVGTNKSDAAETVHTLLADLAGAERTRPQRSIESLLESRGCPVVTYDHWLRLDTAETELARSLDRGERVKLGTWERMRDATGR
jgi:ferredoxin--NADP+ reductase